MPGLRGQSLLVGFEDVSLGAPAVEIYSGPGGGVYYNGSDLSGGFTSSGVSFENLYNASWDSWSGWAYSTTTDVTTEGYLNQYSSFAGTAFGGQTYGIAFMDSYNGFNPIEIELPSGWQAPQGMSVSNTTYAALTLLNGDGFFAEPFAQDDFFKLTIQGLGQGGEIVGTIVHYLADYRGDPGTHFVQQSWEYLDLSPLGTGIARLSLSVESTDIGAYGMNTPAYIAIDDLLLGATPVPEPGAVALILGLLSLWLVFHRRR